jgi:hypothetical protein
MPAGEAIPDGPDRLTEVPQPVPASSGTHPAALKSGLRAPSGVSPAGLRAGGHHLALVNPVQAGVKYF